MVEIMLVAIVLALFVFAAIYALSGAPGDWTKRVEAALAKPVPCNCPRISDYGEPVMLDEDGTLASISGEPGRPGHAVDAYYWFCEDYANAGAEEETP